MEKTEQTTQAASVAALMKQPKEGIQTVIELVEHLTDADGKGKGKRLIIERRKLNPETPVEAPRAESSPRAHQFFAAAGFVAYIKKFGSENTVVLADSEARTVEAILDDKAEHGREVVTLKPQTHPRWLPWRECLGRRLDLDSFRQLITDNRRSITNPDSRQLVFTFRQIRMSQDVQLQSGVVKGADPAVNGLIVRTTITGGGKEQDTIHLPESITVTTPVLVDEKPQDIEMDLILGAKRDGSGVYCQLASADLKEAEIAAFDALVARLRTDLEGERFTVAHGSFDESTWDRVRG